MSSRAVGPIAPFLMGAATALSLVYLFGDDRKQQPPRQPRTTSRRTSRPEPPIRTSNKEFVHSSSSPPEDPVHPVTTTTISTARSGTTTTAATSQSFSSSSSTTTSSLMDSMDLDQRLLRKAEAVIQWRTSRIILVVERCTNDHNYSAILRTTEALGVQTVFMIDPPPPPPIDEEDATITDVSSMTQQERRKLKLSTPEELEARRQHHLFAKKATEWLTVKDFETTEDCVQELRRLNYQLWVTDLSQQAEALTMNSNSTPNNNIKIPHKVALVMGTEAVGCSQYLLEQADKRVYLPLRGYADSLNLSVATALILHQLFCMDPTLIGGMSEVERNELRKAWYTKLCQQRLLTPAQRKTRVKLQGMIQKCQAIQDKKEKGTIKLQPSEELKLQELPNHIEKLRELEAVLDPTKVQAAIQEWVDHPPTPLTDVRRADEHRVAYVGKNTRLSNQTHWKDMAATANGISLHMSSAKEFREKLQAVDQTKS